MNPASAGKPGAKRKAVKKIIIPYRQTDRLIHPPFILNIIADSWLFFNKEIIRLG
jgi:hypothetical protein